MRVVALTLTVLLAAACAGDSGPAGEDPYAPPSAPAPPAPPSGGTGPAPDVIGATRLAKVVSPEWEAIEEYTRQFYEGEFEALHARFSEEYRQEFSLQDLTALRDKTRAEYGEEVEVVATRTQEKEGYRAFFRATRFSGDERLIEIAWVVGEDGSISGLFVTPDRSARPSPQ